MLEAPTSVSSLKNTTHRRLPVGSLVRHGFRPEPCAIRPHTGPRAHHRTFVPNRDAIVISPDFAFDTTFKRSVTSYTHPYFPRSTPVPLHSNPESIEYGVRNGDRRRDGPARGASPDAEVLVRRSRRLRRKSILDARVRPRERHAPHTRRSSEHPDRPVDQHLPGDDHGGSADDAEDQDRVHHGTQVLGRGVHGQADRRRHGRRALQLLPW